MTPDENLAYLSFDPGITTGWAQFNAKGELKGLGQVDILGLYAMLEALYIRQHPLQAVIVEDYKLFQHKAMQQSGSRLETVKVIGALEAFAHRAGVALVLQPPTIKRIAEKWSGMKPPSNHSISHQIDAYNHGYYYLVNHKVVKPIILTRNQEK